MSRRVNLLLVVAFLIWTMGCSGGGNIPMAPDNTGGPISPDVQVRLEPIGGQSTPEGDSELRVPIAFYTFKADPDAGTVDIELLRAAKMHLNGVAYLEDGPQKLLSIVGAPKFSNGGKQLDVNIKITHPNSDPIFTGFDVHGVLITKGTMTGWQDTTVVLAGPNETRLMNPDGMTRWWNPKEFTKYGIYGYDPGELGSMIPGNTAATVNGYKTFAAGLGELSTMSDLDPAKRGMFPVSSSCTRHYTISLKGGLVFNYAVDMSWAFPTKIPPTPPGDFSLKANMPEPYWIKVEEWINTLWYEQWEGFGGNVFYHVTIHDWQGKDTIGAARIEIPGIGVNADLWNIIEQGANYKKYDFRVILPTLTSSNDLDVLISVDSSDGNYQPAQTGVNISPLRAYHRHTTDVADKHPTFNLKPVCIMYATTPTDILKGQTVSFSAADSYDPDGKIIDYKWDFNNDGYFGDPWTTGTAAVPTKQFNEFGNYHIKCQVEDNNHAIVTSAEVLVNVTDINNLMPFAIAKATTPTTIMSDQTVSFDASESYDIDGLITSYLWDFDGDGVYGDPYVSGDDVHPTAQWPAGEYDVDLKVVDNEGGTGTLSKKIHVSVGNYPPEAHAVPTTGTDILTGESVSFDASGSFDVDGTVDLYEWDFDGDGTYGDSYDSGTDVMPTKIYTDVGAFDVDLRITDNLGAKDTLDVKIHVTTDNLPPVAAAIAVTPTDIFKNGSVEFDASGSNDPNGTIVSYLWDFNGDGTFGDSYDSGTDIYPVKIYGKAGTFLVNLKVVDNNSAEDVLDEVITVNVTNQPPTAAMEFAVSPPYYINTYYDISASTSSDPDGTITTYEWDTNYNSVTFNPTYFTENITTFWTVEGDYDIMLRVVDDDGAEDFLDAPMHITVEWTDNGPPVIDSIQMSRTTTKKNTPAEAITFTCNAHDPNVGDVLTYKWTCTVGSFNVDDQKTVVWTAPNQVGHFYVTCRVYDSFNAWDEKESDMIRVTQYPTDLATAPPAYYFNLEKLLTTGYVKLADYNPPSVVMINFWIPT